MCYTPNENFYQILIFDSVHLYVIVSQNKYCLNQNYAQSSTLCCKFLHSSYFYLGEVRWCVVLVNFQHRGVILIWIIVEHGPITLAVGAGGGCLDIFLLSVVSCFSLPLSETARNRLIYCLKGLFTQNNRPTKFLLLFVHRRILTCILVILRILLVSWKF